MVTKRNNLTSHEILPYTYTSITQNFQNFKTQFWFCNSSLKWNTYLNTEGEHFPCLALYDFSFCKT